MHYTEIMPKFTVDGSVINICQRVVKIKIFYFFFPSQVHGPFAVSRSYKQVKVKSSLCGDWDEGRAEPEMLRGQVCPRARALDTDAVWMPVGWSARVSRTTAPTGTPAGPSAQRSLLPSSVGNIFSFRVFGKPIPRIAHHLIALYLVGA